MSENRAAVGANAVVAQDVPPNVLVGRRPGAASSPKLVRRGTLTDRLPPVLAVTANPRRRGHQGARVVMRRARASAMPANTTE